MLLLLMMVRICVMVREIAQEPHGHRADQDDSAHLLQILLSFLPGMTKNRFTCRYAVRRKLHHKRKVVILEETAHYLGRYYRQDYT